MVTSDNTVHFGFDGYLSVFPSPRYLSCTQQRPQPTSGWFVEDSFEGLDE